MTAAIAIPLKRSAGSEPCGLPRNDNFKLHPGEMADELVDRGLPAELSCVREAALARDRQRRASGPPQIVVDDPGAAVADHIVRPRRRESRHRHATGHRLE